MIGAGLTRTEALYVARRLRPESAAEVDMVVDWTRDELAAWLHGRPGLKWTVFHGPTPCAVIGAYPCPGDAWSLYGLGTTDYGREMLQVTRFCRRVLTPAVWATGARRMESIVPAAHTVTRAWLRMLGGTEAETLRAIGRGGEDAVRIIWERA